MCIIRLQVGASADIGHSMSDGGSYCFSWPDLQAAMQIFYLG